MKNQPSEKISRGLVGEVIAPSSLPPALAALARDWEKLTYDERVADAKQRPIADRVQMLRVLGGTFKSAIQLVREFRPLLEACRDELSQPGRHVPVDGKPTWTEFVPKTFGFSARRMQQLLGEGNESPKLGSPATRRERAKRGSNSSDDGQNDQLASLALRLARCVVERGLAAQFPEAEAILNILDTTRRVQPLMAGGSTEGHLGPVVQNSNEASSTTPTARADNAAGPRAAESEFQLLPNCYVCGTGIEFCEVHEPEHRRLMVDRGLHDLDAADLLKEQYAALVRKLSKVS